MKIAIVGTRGIPAKYGGFETFAEELSVRLAKENYDVTVFCDQDSYHSNSYMNVNLVFISCTKSQHPILYYLKSILKAIKQYDIVYVAGTGGSFFYLFNLFYMKTLITNTDGIEYSRAKWNAFKKTYIFLSEFLAVILSNYVIADSTNIYIYLKKKYPRISHKIRVIEYGARINEQTCDESVMEKYKLKLSGYYLVVARLEPENNIDIIIKGFVKSGSSQRLVIIGNVSKNNYVETLLKISDSRVVFPGSIYDKYELKNIRKGCLAYFHGHSAGGTNPSLLEALGSGNITICHDNIFNREVTESKMFYFKDAEDISDIIKKLEIMNIDELFFLKNYGIRRIKDYYNWDNITKKYMELLLECKIAT